MDSASERLSLSRDSVQGQEGASQNQEIDWTCISLRLAGARELASLKILEKIYIKPGHPYVLDILSRELRPVAKSKVTVWRKVQLLKRLGLVDTVGKSPLIIWPKKDLNRQNVQRLLKLCYSHILGDSFAEHDD